MFLLSTILHCTLASVAHETNVAIYETVPCNLKNKAPFFQGDVVEISSLHDIADELQKIDQNTVVVFDVDEVLITSRDHFFHPQVESFVLELVKKEMALTTSKDEQKALEDKLSLSLIQTERILIENDSPQLLNALLKKGVKVVALTSFPTGKFGKIPALERLRIDQLKSFGINFYSKNTPRHEFTEISKPSIPPPLYEDGILFSRGYSKGEVLIAFLDFIKWKPSKVIFIDDLYANHENMMRSLNARTILYQGYRYSGVDLPENKIDKEVIEWQFSTLLKQNKWVSHEQAKQALDIKCKQ